MIKQLIFVDDERRPSDVTWMHASYEGLLLGFHSIQIIRDFERFKKFVDSLSSLSLSKSVFSFDHDLQDFDVDGKEYTGYDCLKYLVEVCIDKGSSLPREVYFHTQNPVGRENMKAYYDNAVKFISGL